MDIWWNRLLEIFRSAAIIITSAVIIIMLSIIGAMIYTKINNYITNLKEYKEISEQEDLLIKEYHDLIPEIPKLLTEIENVSKFGKMKKQLIKENHEHINLIGKRCAEVFMNITTIPDIYERVSQLVILVSELDNSINELYDWLANLEKNLKIERLLN